MSSNFLLNRPPLRTYSKTYSKRKLQDGLDDTSKRRRVLLVEDDSEECTPSSDLAQSDDAIFSEENLPPSTPPSSPPCLSRSPEASPLKQFASPKASGDKLLPIFNSTAKPQKPRVQMQLNFGQSMRKTCKECRMEYVPSAPEDVALHKKFHAQYTSGVPMDRSFLAKIKSKNALWHGPHGDFIVSLSGSRDPKHWLKKARVVFELATTDLGAVDISDERLWGSQSSSGTLTRAVAAKEEVSADRYKLYLYMDNGRCVGLCLAEGIDKAFKVVRANKAEEKKEEGAVKMTKASPAQGGELLILSEETDEATIGISRIWTSKGSRKKGIAKALLKCVAKTFMAEVTAKDKVAFSQPTEMGTALARRWFGEEYGWHVYVD